MKTTASVYGVKLVYGRCNYTRRRGWCNGVNALICKGVYPYTTTGHRITPRGANPFLPLRTLQPIQLFGGGTDANAT